MNLEQATPQQLDAINSDAPDITAIAGPGSGKSATLVARIKRLIASGVPPGEIAVMTFTNAAARELGRRLGTVKAHENGDESMPPIDAEIDLGFNGTLHAFALRMLREYGEGIGYGAKLSMISPEASEDLLASKAKSMGCKLPFADLLALKGAGLPPASGRFDVGRTVVATYLAEMRAAGVVDYDLLLQEFLRLLTERSPAAQDATAEIAKRFRYLFVDEVQDSAPLDWLIYLALVCVAKFFVGDPDQAIYAFRGGRVAELIGHTLLAGSKVVYLEANFRSRPEICEAAQRLIQHNFARLKKETRSAQTPGGAVVVLPTAMTDGEEIAIVAREIRKFDASGRSVAILARTNDIADGFRKELPGAGVPVVEVKRTALPRDWRLARAFIEMSVDPENDALAFFYLVAIAEFHGALPAAARAQAHKQRIKAAAAGESINRALGFGRITRPSNAIEALAKVACRETRAIVAEKYQELDRGASMLDLTLALSEVREHVAESDEDGVRILTMHGAKGREFDVVFLVGFEDEVCPGPRAIRAGGEAIEEERRVAYVAVTRARDMLYISSAASRSSAWQKGQRRTPSRFLREMISDNDII